MVKKQNKTRKVKKSHRNTSHKINSRRSSFTFDTDALNSDNGMLTTVWGPSLWHSLHTMSFNYPVKPKEIHKKKYMELIKNLKYTLPCIYCRINLKNNFKEMPLKQCHMKSRETFSRYVYDLHEKINCMLGKKSNLSYDDVRQRYENFRARCDKKTIKHKIWKSKKSMSSTKTKKKEKGCVEPYYGKKSKCIIKIVPQDENTSNESTFQMDEKCYRYKE